MCCMMMSMWMLNDNALKENACHEQSVRRIVRFVEPKTAKSENERTRQSLFRARLWVQVSLFVWVWLWLQHPSPMGWGRWKVMIGALNKWVELRCQTYCIHFKTYCILFGIGQFDVTMNNASSDSVGVNESDDGYSESGVNVFVKLVARGGMIRESHVSPKRTAYFWQLTISMSRWTALPVRVRGWIDLIVVIQIQVWLAM